MRPDFGSRFVREASDACETGNLVATPSDDEWPFVRDALQSLAAWYIDGGQAVKAQIALSEVERLARARRHIQEPTQ